MEDPRAGQRGALTGLGALLLVLLAIGVVYRIGDVVGLW